MPIWASWPGSHTSCSSTLDDVWGVRWQPPPMGHVWGQARSWLLRQVMTRPPESTWPSEVQTCPSTVRKPSLCQEKYKRSVSRGPWEGRLCWCLSFPERRLPPHPVLPEEASHLICGLEEESSSSLEAREALGRLWARAQRGLLSSWASEPRRISRASGGAGRAGVCGAHPSGLESTGSRGVLWGGGCRGHRGAQRDAARQWFLKSLGRVTLAL